MHRPSKARNLVYVAPHVGAWIEISPSGLLAKTRLRRSSCRSVD